MQLVSAEAVWTVSEGGWAWASLGSFPGFSALDGQVHRSRPGSSITTLKILILTRTEEAISWPRTLSSYHRLVPRGQKGAAPARNAE